MPNPQKSLLLLNMAKCKKKKISFLPYKTRAQFEVQNTCLKERKKSQPEGIQAIKLWHKWAARTKQADRKLLDLQHVSP